MQAWWDDVTAIGFESVAQELGLRRMKSRTWGPCPSCGAESRGADGRGAIGMRGQGWMCHRGGCGATGDAADLLAFHVAGDRVRNLSTEDRSRVRDRAIQLGWTGNAPQVSRPLPPRPSPASRRGSKGSWQAFRVVSGGKVEVAPPPDPSTVVPRFGFHWDPELEERARVRLWTEEAQAVRDYLMEERKLPEGILHEAGIGAHWAKPPGQPDAEPMWWAVIPLREDGETVNYKFRAIPSEECPKPKPKYMTCPGRPCPLFGAHTLDADRSVPVMVFEGELDVLAAMALGWTASVVSGTTGDSWQDEWLDLLEPYEEILLCGDRDEAGDAAAEKVADALGRRRCSRVKLPTNDMGDALRLGVEPGDIQLAISQADSMVSMRIVKPSFHRHAIEESITNPGLRWKRHGHPTGDPVLDEMFSGWPVGVVGVTGGSGDGKTSFTNWACWMLGKLKQTVLIASFENGDEDASENLLRMELGDDPAECSANDRAEAWDAIDEHVRIINHHGHSPIEELIEVMVFAVRRLGVRIFLLDHLGYMVDRASRESATQQIQRIMLALSAFTRDYSTTVFLVVHPDKRPHVAERRATIYDGKESNAIPQECVLAIGVEQVVRQRMSDPPQTVVHIDKARPKVGEGRGAQRTLFYDPTANRYASTFHDLPMAQPDTEDAPAS